MTTSMHSKKTVYECNFSYIFFSHFCFHLLCIRSMSGFWICLRSSWLVWFYEKLPSSLNFSFKIVHCHELGRIKLIPLTFNPIPTELIIINHCELINHLFNPLVVVTYIHFHLNFYSIATICRLEFSKVQSARNVKKVKNSINLNEILILAFFKFENQPSAKNDIKFHRKIVNSTVQKVTKTPKGFMQLNWFGQKYNNKSENWSGD